jgi:hypothetical protein
LTRHMARIGTWLLRGLKPAFSNLLYPPPSLQNAFGLFLHLAIYILKQLQRMFRSHTSVKACRTLMPKGPVSFD